MVWFQRSMNLSHIFFYINWPFCVFTEVNSPINLGEWASLSLILFFALLEDTTWKYSVLLFACKVYKILKSLSEMRINYNSQFHIFLSLDLFHSSVNRLTTTLRGKEQRWEGINQITYMHVLMAHEHRQQSSEGLRGAVWRGSIENKRDICNTFIKD